MPSSGVDVMDAPVYPWSLMDHIPGIGEVVREQGFGLSQRAYAAIALKVPDSGVPWLDVMIERSRRDQIVESLLPYTLKECTEDKVKNPGNPWTARDAAVGWAYQVANVAIVASRMEAGQ